MSLEKRTKKEKLLEKAGQALIKNDWEGALEVFKEIHKISLKDSGVLQRLAELYEKTGDKSKAIQCYKEAAEYYAEEGFSNKAIELFERVLVLDYTCSDVKEEIVMLQAYLEGAFILPNPEEPEKLPPFSKYYDEIKKKSILEFIRDTCAAAGKGDHRAEKFIKEVRKIFLPKLKKSKK